MEFPARAQAIVDALYARHEPLAKGSEDDRRTLTLMMAQQLCYVLGDRWGTKASSATNPQSKDGLAFLDDIRQALIVFDWQNGATREVIPYPAAQEIPGQHFIAVEPVNHLGTAEAPGEPAAPTHIPPPSMPYADPLWAFRVNVEAWQLQCFQKLDDQHAAVLAKLDALEQHLTKAVKDALAEILPTTAAFRASERTRADTTRKRGKP